MSDFWWCYYSTAIHIENGASHDMMCLLVLVSCNKLNRHIASNPHIHLHTHKYTRIRNHSPQWIKINSSTFKIDFRAGKLMWAAGTSENYLIRKFASGCFSFGTLNWTEFIWTLLHANTYLAFFFRLVSVTRAKINFLKFTIKYSLCMSNNGDCVGAVAEARKSFHTFTHQYIHKYSQKK